MASHHEIAEKAAEKVLQIIERNKRIIRADIVEAIEGVLAIQPRDPAYGHAACCETKAVSRETPATLLVWMGTDWQPLWGKE